MKVNAYIIAIPKSLTVENLIEDKPELRTYGVDICEGSEEQDYSYIGEVLQELMSNVEVDISGEFKRMAILYYIIDYARDHNQLLGEIKIPGKIEKIVSVEAKNIKENTRHHILQHGLLGEIVRKLNGL